MQARQEREKDCEKKVLGKKGRSGGDKPKEKKQRKGKGKRKIGK
jgi:hypothetical protein